MDQWRLADRQGKTERQKNPVRMSKKIFVVEYIFEVVNVGSFGTFDAHKIDALVASNICIFLMSFLFYFYTFLVFIHN